MLQLVDSGEDSRIFTHISFIRKNTLFFNHAHEIEHFNHSIYNQLMRWLYQSIKVNKYMHTSSFIRSSRLSSITSLSLKIKMLQPTWHAAIFCHHTLILLNCGFHTRWNVDYLCDTCFFYFNVNLLTKMRKENLDDPYLQMILPNDDEV